MKSGDREKRKKMPFAGFEHEPPLRNVEVETTRLQTLLHAFYYKLTTHPPANPSSKKKYQQFTKFCLRRLVASECWKVRKKGILHKFSLKRD